MVIDNDTQREVYDHRSDRIARIAAYEATMNAITNSDHWVTPDTHYRNGRPQGLENHGHTSHGGAYADAEEMVKMGYAIGAF